MENITDHLSGIDFILKAVKSHWKALSSEGMFCLVFWVYCGCGE